MNKKIIALKKKYNEMVIRMALSHLFNVGADSLLNQFYRKDGTVDEQKLEASCQSILADTAANALVSGEMLALTHRCAVDMASIDLWDILRFVQTDIAIGNTKVHPGTFVKFLRKNSEESIATICIPPYASEEGIEEALDALAYQSEQPYWPCTAQNIYDAFHAVGIRPQEIPCDETVFL